MDKHPLQIADGRVIVNTAVLEQGAPLGSRQFDTEARGGSCAPAAEG
jgi:hypothetical protein